MKDSKKVYPVRNNARFSAAGLDFTIIPAGFNPLRLRDSAASAPLEFLTGLTGITRREPCAVSE